MEFGAQIQSGLQQVEKRLLQLRNSSGHWTGELSSSALATATAITAIEFYVQSTESTGEQLRQQVEAGAAWLIGQQNEDGGFGDTTLSHSNISTTMLTVAA